MKEGGRAARGRPGLSPEHTHCGTPGCCYDTTRESRKNARRRPLSRRERNVSQSSSNPRFRIRKFRNGTGRQEETQMDQEGEPRQGAQLENSSKLCVRSWRREPNESSHVLSLQDIRGNKNVGGRKGRGDKVSPGASVVSQAAR